ncbi:MAG: TetR family transcriptional regulator [Acidimicrobiia bacterium]
MTTAATARGRRTRERLLEATAELVATRGFHAVAITDIGGAAGVTGSAIYRHFASKQDLLVALLDRVVGELLAGARTVVDSTPRASDALDALVTTHVDFALRDRNLIRVYDQEADHLPAADRRRIRRAMRAYAEQWVRVLRTVRPDVDDAAARTAVHAAFGLVNSVADYRSPLTDAQLRNLLVSMTLAALMDPGARA